MIDTPGPRAIKFAIALRERNKLWDDRKGHVLRSLRILSHPQIEQSRLDCPLTRLRAPEPKVARVQRHRHRPLLAGPQMNPRKALQLAPRPRSTASTLMRVELHNLIPRKDRKSVV